jgi:hypothetical protein
MLTLQRCAHCTRWYICQDVQADINTAAVLPALMRLTLRA